MLPRPPRDLNHTSPISTISPHSQANQSPQAVYSVLSIPGRSSPISTAGPSAGAFVSATTRPFASASTSRPLLPSRAIGTPFSIPRNIAIRLCNQPSSTKSSAGTSHSDVPSLPYCRASGGKSRSLQIINPQPWYVAS